MGEGDCDYDSQCKEGLVCKHDYYCGHGFPKYFDCCGYGKYSTNFVYTFSYNLLHFFEKATSGTSCKNNVDDWSCCRSWNPCDEGEGDCDSDVECKEGLVCGYNNYCGPGFPSGFDCCVRPETINPVPVPTKPPVKPPSPTCPPVPQNPILRFVLSWNVLTDLDHHIKVFESGGKEICHLYYGNKYCFGAFLHDDLEEVCRMF